MPREAVDFYDVKADLEALLARDAASRRGALRRAALLAACIRGASARIYRGDRAVRLARRTASASSRGRSSFPQHRSCLSSN